MEFFDDLKPKIEDPYLNLINIIGAEELNCDITKKYKLKAIELDIVNTLQEQGRLNKIELLIEALKNNVNISSIAKYISWNDFEKLIAAIFKYSGWEVKTNYRFFGEGSPSNRKHYEVDVVAWKKPFVAFIDCKRHKIASASIMKKAAEFQKNRIIEFYDQIPFIHDSLPNFIKWNKFYLMPLIISWRDSQIIEYEGVPICASSYLFDLIANFELYFWGKEWFYLTWNGIV